MTKRLEKEFQQELQRRHLSVPASKPPSSSRKRQVVAWGMLISLVAGSIYYITNGLTPSTVDSAPSPPVSKAPPPVEPPPTSILYSNPVVSRVAEGRLSFFLRPPQEGETVAQSDTCAPSSDMATLTRHYLVELVDWESDQVMIRAFIRSGETLEIPVPFGSYKVRYTHGSQWYGPQKEFGPDMRDEITEQFSSEPKQFTFSTETPGRSLMVYCMNGNLGTHKVKKNTLPDNLPMQRS